MSVVLFPVDVSGAVFPVGVSGAVFHVGVSGVECPLLVSMVLSVHYWCQWC